MSLCKLGLQTPIIASGDLLGTDSGAWRAIECKLMSAEKH